ncbi:MAG TPA: cytochrome D1 domain-containing protein [Bryobacteraceae bacterium]|nr:cytochrome D1 domain-containing protein [Bryobacteraceae bacterium]
MNSIRRENLICKAAGVALLVQFFAAASVLAAAETPSPALLVLNKEDNTLAIVDPATGKVAGLVPTGESPHEVTVSSDGKFAFVGNYGAQTPGKTISVIDLAAQKEVRRVDLGPLRRPHGVFFADGKLYFTAQVNKVIGRYAPESNLIDWLLGTGQDTTHMVMVAKNGNRIFTSNIGSNSITIMERATGPVEWEETVVSVGQGPEGFDLSPDEKELWAANSRDGSVSVVDIAAKKVVQTIDVHTKRSNRLKFTLDGKQVLISDMAGNQVVVLDAAARKEIKRIKPGHSPEGILMAPDGKQAYVAVSGDDKIAILDLSTLKVTGQISTGRGPDGMAWTGK